jgi:GNAT superfamily N-acetyltransferase
MIDWLKCQIRPATNADRKSIETLIFGILNEYGLKPDPGATDSDLADIEQNYFADGGSFDVLVDDTGTIVGTVGVYRLNDTSCEIRKMYLDSRMRGQGLGRRLLEHALATAKNMGYSRIELETASVLKEAIALYERFGFQRFERPHMASRCNAAYFMDL